MGDRTRHSREFKVQAARLVVEQGYSISKAAEHLGLSTWSVRDWVRQLRADGTFPPVGQVVAEAEEMKRLRKELAEMRQERDILKKRWCTSPRTSCEVRLHSEARRGVSDACPVPSSACQSEWLLCVEFAQTDHS